MPRDLGSYGYLHFKSNNHQVQSVRKGFPLSTLTLDESIIVHGNHTIPRRPHNGLRMEESDSKNGSSSFFVWFAFSRGTKRSKKMGTFRRSSQHYQPSKTSQVCHTTSSTSIRKKDTFMNKQSSSLSKSEVLWHLSAHSDLIIILPPILRP